MSGRLEGKVALITGAARGQGEAEARRFVAEGARVLLTDVLDVEGAGVAEELGDVAAYRHLDVSSEQEWEGAVADCEERFGPISILINNAGILDFSPLQQQDVEKFRRVLDVNVVGTMLGMKVGSVSMRKARGGSIINISSTGGLWGLPFLSAYVASKFAVRGMSKTAALELGRYGIRVNTIHPGGIDTAMTRFGDNPGEAPYYKRLPISRMGTVEEVANMALFLASDESSFSTGCEFIIDGGATAGDVGLVDT